MVEITTKIDQELTPLFVNPNYVQSFGIAKPSTNHGIPNFAGTLEDARAAPIPHQSVELFHSKIAKHNGGTCIYFSRLKSQTKLNFTKN